MKETDINTVIRYEGEINSELSRGLTLAVHNQMNGIESDLLTRKRVTHLITECLLNLTHHAEVNSENSHNGKYVRLLIENGISHYFIQTCNIISNKKINFLKNVLDKINSMGSGELYEHYMNQLQSGQYTNKGTAGLGFIDMARKSNNKLSYQFQELNALYSNFIFELTIEKNKKK